MFLGRVFVNCPMFVHSFRNSKYSNNKTFSRCRAMLRRAKRTTGTIRTTPIIRRSPFRRRKVISWSNKSRMAVPANNRRTSYRRLATIKCCRRCDAAQTEILTVWVSRKGVFRAFLLPHLNIYTIMTSGCTDIRSILSSYVIENYIILIRATNMFFLVSFYFPCRFKDENVIGLSLQEILPDNNNIKTEKMLVANPPNILKRAKSMKMENAVSANYIHATGNVPIFSLYLSLSNTHEREWR